MKVNLRKMKKCKFNLLKWKIPSRRRQRTASKTARVSIVVKPGQKRI